MLERLRFWGTPRAVTLGQWASQQVPARSTPARAPASIQWVPDHCVSRSIYVADPDGNNVELYVDASPDIWRRDPSAVAQAVDLEL
jgi:catechol 2,3-dioxygenase